LGEAGKPLAREREKGANPQITSAAELVIN
jgi:hypothetical protein